MLLLIECPLGLGAGIIAELFFLSVMFFQSQGRIPDTCRSGVGEAAQDPDQQLQRHLDGPALGPLRPVAAAVRLRRQESPGGLHR